jgi:hypothetical protein
MTGALDHEARGALDRFIQQARRLLEADLAREAEGRYGIHAGDGEIEHEEDLHLDPSGLAARRDIVAVLEFLRREEGSHADAAGRLIREAAFTHLNRLLAIRIAEAVGLLPQSLAEGSSSSGFKELLEVAPLLAHEKSGGYWLYLQLCGDELAADLPQLFDPRNPLLALEPSAAAFDDIVALIRGTELDGVWDAPDALGWAYQFFNSGDERRAMRDESASPRTSRELAVRNQFFTPRYVVDFLVHNSLGRRLLEANPSSELLQYLPMLIDPPSEATASVELDDVRVLDPACGSGHFLLGAYDLLEVAWALQGVSPQDAAPRIIQSLWGIDIDSRCAQVAAAAIVFRARRHSRGTDLPRPNIITARPLPEPSGGWADMLATLPADRRQLLASIHEALDQVSVLGSLLRVEELLASEIKTRIAEADDDPSTLFGSTGMAHDAFGQAETEVLELLQQIADSSTSGPADRLFAAEAQDAIRFVEAMRQRYDAVLMNPPFGEPVADTKQYLRAAYPWIPTRDYNILAAFVGRGIELCKPDGRMGAITSRAGMFQVTSERWRQEVILAHRLFTLADLGYGVMEQAQVEAAAYVIGAEPPVQNDPATFIRLLRDRDRDAALVSAVSAAKHGTVDRRLYRVASDEFDAVPSKPLAYWMTESIRRLFRDLPPIEGHGAEARVGLQSGDDFRFVRTIWEVDPRRIANSRDGTHVKRWAPFGKGGEYSPYWADINLVVDWEDDGKRVRNYAGARPQNTQYFFRRGLTWPDRATTLAPRVLPEGCVFSHVGMGLFPTSDPLVCLAWLNSRLARAFADLMVSGREESSNAGGSPHYYVGVVQRIPWPDQLDDDTRGELRRQCLELVELRRSRDLSDETTRSFRAPTLARSSAESLETIVHSEFKERAKGIVTAIDAVHSIDCHLAASLKISDESSEFLDEEAPASSAVHPAVALDDHQRADVLRLASLSMSDLVVEAVERCGGSRSVVAKSFAGDRRTELIAQIVQRHPSVVLSTLIDSNYLPPGQLTSSAKALMSYLIGAAFGRWDVRAAQTADPASNPFDLVASCPPGALIDHKGLPVSVAPAGYPLELPPNRLLLDEPGHQWDLIVRVDCAVKCLFDDPDAIVGELSKILGRALLRDYLRRDFFKSHLAQYTESRRKAPIYWPLSVPSGKWTVWVYAPTLSRESLYAVASEALRRENLATAEIGRLEQERTTGAGGRGARTLDRALDTERLLGEELRRFRQEAERIANLGWEPDLDDGIVLCAAPLAGLFPQWREPAQYRNLLKAGQYEWATVSRWAEAI